MTLGIVKFPYRGAPTTVEAIRKAAHKSQHFLNLRKLAEEICKDLRPRDYLSEYLAFYYWTFPNTRYMRDPRTVELVKAPHEVAAEAQAGGRPQLDCDDYAAFLCSLGMISGARTRVVTAAFDGSTYNGERQYSHIWAELQEPKTKVWIALDPVAAAETRSMITRARALKIWPVA